MFYKDNWGQEVQLCKKIKPYKDYLKYTLYPNLIAWYEHISDVLDNPIVKCEACPKEFKNHTGSRFLRDDNSFCYACSNPCRAKLHEIDRRLKQKQKRADLIDARFRQTSSTSNNTPMINLDDADFELQERINEWIEKNEEMRELQNNALRVLRRVPKSEDIGGIFKVLAKNNNDAFHALCEIESQKPYNYIQMRYLSENNESNFIKA